MIGVIHVASPSADEAEHAGTNDETPVSVPEVSIK